MQSDWIPEMVDGAQGQGLSAALWSVTGMGVLVHRATLGWLGPHGAMAQTTDGGHRGAQVLPARAASTGPLGRGGGMDCSKPVVFTMVLCKVVLYSSSWLPLVRAGESESVLT